MEPVRPLHDIFAGLASDPAARRGEGPEPSDALRDGGHGDLPEGLVAEAIVSYADTAPAEVAEHLAPFVAGHGPVPLDDPAAAGLDVTHGLELVATAPVADPGTVAEVDDEPFDVAFGEGTGGEPVEAVELDPDLDPADVAFEVPADPGFPVEPALGLPETDPADLFPMPGPPEAGDAGEPDDPGADGG